MNIIVGMSGGVDSSVSAALLVEQGHEVRGLFMDNWDDDDGYCSAAEDFQDARQVAAELDIPLQRICFAEEYKDRVFSYFLREYQAGRTPNPDVLCNREIKFKAFLNYASRLGADAIATGHYARRAGEGAEARLLKGADTNKDQSYFLHAIEQPALAQTVFPIGELPKPQVRELAESYGLANHAKRDSTGICFIGERKFRQFLGQYLPTKPGDIVTDDGTIIGEHQGLMFYTLGQRQGLGIGGQADASEAPWYVADKHMESNQVVVVQGHDHPLLMRSGLLATDVHWLSPDLSFPLSCQAKTRYRQQDQICTVVHQQGQWRVDFATPQRAVTPGQFVVFYQGDECLGGGIIESTF